MDRTRQHARGLIACLAFVGCPFGAAQASDPATHSALDEAQRHYIDLFNSDRPHAATYADSLEHWLADQGAGNVDVQRLSAWLAQRKEIARLFQHSGHDLAACTKGCYATNRHVPYSARALMRSSKLPFAWHLPPGFPAPREPADNPTTPAKAELGRYLFYDVRLSQNGKQSCASCHQQKFAFTDGRTRAMGSTGAVHRRNSMTLANVAYAEVLAWANPKLRSLEEQARVPMFGEHPVELGFGGRENELVARLSADALYHKSFREAFPNERVGITVENIVRALAAFERTLISGNTPYDKFVYQGRSEALSPEAQRGMRLFFSARIGCGNCHAGFNLSGAVVTQAPDVPMANFHNTGLYDTDGKGTYPAEDLGLHELGGQPADMGRFKAPTLRNIAVTAPYMHDGSVATLDEVIDHYARGGRAGARSIYKSHLVPGFDLSSVERRDLIAFLESLTDEGFLENPQYANPHLRTASAYPQIPFKEPTAHASPKQ